MTTLQYSREFQLYDNPAIHWGVLAVRQPCKTAGSFSFTCTSSKNLHFNVRVVEQKRALKRAYVLFWTLANHRSGFAFRSRFKARFVLTST